MFSISKNTAAIDTFLIKFQVTWTVSLLPLSVVEGHAWKSNWLFHYVGLIPRGIFWLILDWPSPNELPVVLFVCVLPPTPLCLVLVTFTLDESPLQATFTYSAFRYFHLTLSSFICFINIFLFARNLGLVSFFRTFLSLGRFYRVLTMVYNTQNYWGFGLYPSSGF
jgi:hypothetical protein